MFNRSAVAFTVSIAVALGASHASAGDLFLHNYGGGYDSGEIGTVDPYSGLFSPEGSLNGISAPIAPILGPDLTYVYDIAIAPDGRIFAATSDYVVGSPSGYFSRLWELDLVTPSNSKLVGYIGTPIGGPYFANALGFSPDGTLYAAGWPQFGTYEATVFALDTNSTFYPGDPYSVPYAVPTPVVGYGFVHYAGDIAFTCNGDMYLVPQELGPAPLIRVDVTVPSVTLLPNLSDGVNYQGLAYDPAADTLFGVTYAGGIYSIDESTAVATLESMSGLAGPSGASWSTVPSDGDGDGVCDINDICPGGDDDQDMDADGVPDSCDLCPTEDASLLDVNGDGCLDDAGDVVEDVISDLDGIVAAISDLLANPGSCDVGKLNQAHAKALLAQSKLSDYLISGDYGDVKDGMNMARLAMSKLSAAEGPGCDLTSIKESLYQVALAAATNLTVAAEIAFGLAPEVLAAQAEIDAAILEHSSGDYDQAMKDLRDAVGALEPLY